MADLKKEIKFLPVFMALTCIYFYDVFLNGACLAFGDGFDLSYPMAVTLAEQYRGLTFPFWNPYIYSGFPLFASGGALNPVFMVLCLLFKPLTAFNLNLALYYSLAGFFTFLYARQIGLGIFPSLVAGTIFSLLGYLPAHMMHGLIVPCAWLPLILYFYDRMKQNLHIKDAIYAALIIALQFLAGHPQVSLYIYIVLMLYVLFHMFYLDPSKRWRFALLSVSPIALGLLIALPQILATQELSSMSYRAKTTYEFFSSFAFPVHMILSFIFPFFYYYGGTYNGEYWGLTPELGQEAFVGTLPFLLAMFVLMRWKKNPQILFWGVVAIMAFVFSMGDAIRPLNKLLFYLPGYNIFRAPSKHIFEVSFALSILAGFGISFLQEGEREKRFTTALIVIMSAVVSVSLISFTFFHGPIRDFFKESFSTMNDMMLRWDRSDIPDKALSITDGAVYIPVLAMTVNLVCLFLLLKMKKGYIRNAAFSVIFVVIFAEALLFKQGPLPDAGNVENFNKDTYNIILSAGNSGRTVFMSGNTLPMIATTHGIRLAEGYNPLAIGDYGRILLNFNTQQPEFSSALAKNNSLLSMMDVRYIVADNRLGNLEDIKWYIIRDKDGGISRFPPGLQRPQGADLLPIYRKLASFPDHSVFENMSALPRAYPVIRLMAVNSVDEVREKLFSFQMDPWHEAALSTEDLREIGGKGFSYGDVTIKEDLPAKVTAATSFKSKGFVVLADQFYPGWEAYIDGKQSKIYKTNGVLRGVVVPEGEHTLVFKYVPRRIYASMAVSGILIFGMLFILLKVDNHPVLRTPLLK